MSPEHARVFATLLKHRFPWIGTQRSIEYADEAVRLVEFHELLVEIGKKPETQTAPALMLAALKTAERFVKAERETREQSGLKAKDSLYIREVLETQNIIQRAIVAGELEKQR